MAKTAASSSSEPENNDELEQITIARALLNYRMKEKAALASSPSGSIPFTMKFPSQSLRPTSPQSQSAPTSKILPLICQRSNPRNLRHPLSCSSSSLIESSPLESRVARPHKFPAPGAAPYVPIRPFRMAPPVTIRNMIPVFSAPPPQVRMAPPVSVRQAVPVFAAPPVKEDKDRPYAQKVSSLSHMKIISIKEAPPAAAPVAKKEDAPGAQKEGQEVTEKESTVGASTDSAVEELGKTADTDDGNGSEVAEVVVVQDLKELKI